MPNIRLKQCVNCKTVPMIVPSENPEFDFHLQHKPEHRRYGPAPFNMEIFDDSEEECAKGWNAHVKELSKPRTRGH